MLSFEPQNVQMLLCANLLLLLLKNRYRERKLQIDKQVQAIVDLQKLDRQLLFSVAATRPTQHSYVQASGTLGRLYPWLPTPLELRLCQSEHFVVASNSIRSPDSIRAAWSRHFTLDRYNSSQSIQKVETSCRAGLG
jgi:hypothetical protein